MSGHGSDGNEGVLRILQSSSITETSTSDCFMSYPRRLLGGDLTPLQRSGQCILHPKPIVPPGHSLRRSYSSVEIQSLYSTVPAHWTTRTLVGGRSYPSAEKQSVYSIAQADWVTGTLFEEVLPTVEIKSLYSTVLVDWTTKTLFGGGGLTPLQRSSRCILQPKPIGPPGHSLRRSYNSVEIQSLYSTVPADWTTRTLVGGGVLPLCREVVSIFYSPYSRLVNKKSGKYESIKRE